ncbi:MAG TPA: phospholipase D-like domain-containing protein [Longimicrobiaceae bacterium]|nr:phospholipase D-like domain-containing protein [Longimicrobiaceae bacterium]
MNAILSTPAWVLFFFVLGIWAAITVLVTLFTSLGQRVSAASVTKNCTVDSSDFLLAIAGAVNAPVQEGGNALVLNNGDEFFPRILQALAEAERSINFMIYIWEPGEVSEMFFDALIAKAREGVEVRVMVDGLGGHKAPDERIAELQAASGRWEWFHPPHFGKLTRFHKRNHRRAIIVDGTIGFTGGAAIRDVWLGNAQDSDHWRDCMVEVRGCMAANLQSAFAQLWSHTTGEVLVGPAFYPPEHAEGAEDPGDPLARHINVVSSPSNESHPLRRLFWLSFSAAREKIYITNPYFIPDDAARAILEERAREGVDVRVLVPNEHIDLPPLRWASHSYFGELLDAGVRIYEYQPTMIHQKMLVVDGKWSVVGSANMDVRSKELNQENVLGILDPAFAAEVENTFLRDLERAREIHRDEWHRRGAFARVREKLSLLFEEQI